MLSLVAARYLQRVKQIRVTALYYGALDMTDKDNITPVLNLNGLLGLLDWVDALATYDKDGDYGVFANLLKQDGLSEIAADSLLDGAFCERITRIDKAREPLKTAKAAFDDLTTPVSQLFRSELDSRLVWVDQAERYEWELALARQHFERGDFLRTATLMFEGWISYQLAVQRENPNDQNLRNRQRRQGMNDAREGRLFEQQPPLWRLSAIRNTMAHGEVEQHAQESLMETADETRTTLAMLWTELFPDLPSLSSPER